MSHKICCLNHSHGHEHAGADMLEALTSSQSARKVRHIVMIGCAVNAFLMAIKLITGYFGHSDALMADGIHSLNDFAADLIMLVFVGISFRGPDRRYAYGYGKFETFSSFLISSFLIIVAVMIGFEGIEGVVEFANGKMLPRPDIWTVVVVAFSIICKEGLYRYYSYSGRKVGSQALVANAWHHRMDAMASVATLIGVTFSHFFGENFRVLDPCVTIVIAVLIVIAAVRLLVPAFGELMEHSLPAKTNARTRELVEGIPGVRKIVHLRTRKNGHYRIFDIALGVDPTLTIGQGAVIASEVTAALEKEFGANILPSISTLPA